MKALTQSDLAELDRIIQSLNSKFPELDSQGFSWTRESIRNELDVGKGIGWMQDNRLSAFILYRIAGEALEITLLCTDPEYQRSGMMSELFREFCENNPAKEIWLEVHEKNLKALNFYRKMGFRQTGRRSKYYKDGSAAILMNYQQ